MSRNLRLGLFVVCSAVLGLTAVLVRSGSPSTSDSVVARSTSAAPPPQAVAPTSLGRSAHHFLSAFLRLEVGDRAPGVVRSFHATSTPAFAAELLRAPATTPAPSTAKLQPLAIVVLSRRPLLASVSTVAERRSGPEQLSFVFARRHGRWLASAPGE